jgi:hypothetical protein
MAYLNSARREFLQCVSHPRNRDRRANPQRVILKSPLIPACLNIQGPPATPGPVIASEAPQSIARRKWFSIQRRFEGLQICRDEL